MNTAAVGSVITEIDEDFPDPTPTPMGDNPSYKKEIWTGNLLLEMRKVFQLQICYVLYVSFLFRMEILEEV